MTNLIQSYTSHHCRECGAEVSEGGFCELHPHAIVETIVAKTPNVKNRELTGGNPSRELTGEYSASYSAKPADGRCRYWCKVVRAGERVPMPEDVTGAESVYGPYLRKGDAIEVFAGDWILEGEANHHVKQRGWTYRLFRALPTGWTLSDETVLTETEVRMMPVTSKDKLRALRDNPESSKELKAKCKQLLLGSGDIAAMVREIHYRRLLVELEKVGEDIPRHTVR